MFSSLRKPSTPPPTPEQSLTLLQTQLLSDPQTKTPDSQTFLTKPCLQRYLQARNYNIPKSKQMLLNTLSWRSSYNPSTLYNTHPTSLHSEAATGKMFVLPPTPPATSSLIIMRPGLENSRDPAANIRYLVYTLERAATLTLDGRFIVLIDYFSGRISPATMPPLSVARQTVHILQAHYPERLRAAFLFEPPGYVAAMLRAIRPFLDPVTREKVFVVRRDDEDWAKDLEKVLDVAALPVEYGGELQFQFEPQRYFDSFHT